MELNSRNSFSKGERMVMKVTIPMGNVVSSLKKRKNGKTVRELLEISGIRTETLPTNVQRILDERVNQICRAGSRFTKGCICVQLYDDGPDVLKWAMENGAILCIARFQINDYPCIVVSDPALIYAKMCSAYRRDDITAVAITGSIGKTTAKKMISSMYKEQVKTFCDAGNDNQLDCVGYIAQHIPKNSKVWIQEVSEDTPGSITHISKIVSPNIAVITSIDKSHIEEFGNEQGIVDEIHSVIDYMPKEGVCITSIDDDKTATLINERKVISVSIDNTSADYYTKHIMICDDGLHFSIVEKKTLQEFPIRLYYVFAKHNIYAALYAFACGVESGLKRECILAGIEKYRASGIRQNIYSDRGITIYADCYNAVAKSVRSAVNAADIIPVSGRRIAVIGDIAEAGSYTDSTHVELVNIINESKFDVLLAYGKNTCKATKKVKCRDSLEIICCTDMNYLNNEVKKIVKKGDLILYKASHSTGLEKSLKKCFPVSYWIKTIGYNWPKLIWRIKVILN